MTRIHGDLLVRLSTAVCGLVLAVATTGCGEIGDLGQEEEGTVSPTAEGGEDGERRSSPAGDDEGVEETSTADDGDDQTEEPTSGAEDESAEETEEPAQDYTEEDEDTEESGSEGADGEGPESEATGESLSGSGMTTSETVHLEGDYTVDFEVTDNTLMDMESTFIADLTSADDEWDFHTLVNEIGTEVSGTTNVYGLDGDYYVDVMADGDWSFEFTPQ